MQRMPNLCNNGNGERKMKITRKSTPEEIKQFLARTWDHFTKASSGNLEFINILEITYDTFKQMGRIEKPVPTQVTKETTKYNQWMHIKDFGYIVEYEITNEEIEQVKKNNKKGWFDKLPWKASKVISISDTGELK